MHLSNGLVALAVALGATGALAAPSPAGGKRSITLPLERNAARSITAADGVVDKTKLSQEILRLRTKYSTGLANYQRNAGKKHSRDATSRLASRSTGKVTLSAQEGGALWTGPATWGGQKIYLDYDTGSSDTLVNPDAYSPSQSHSSKDTGTTFRNSYGDGTTASGKVYSDSLTIGGVSTQTAYIGRSQQQFLSNEGNSQGISGMGFPALCSFEQKTPFFQSLLKSGNLDQEGFTMKLRKEAGSSMELGTISQSATYVPVTEAAYWTVDGKINDQSISAIIDSGTTLIVAPPTEAKQLYRSLGLQTQESQGSVQATFDCSSPPDVSMTFGSKTINLGDAVSYGKDQSGQCVFAVVGEEIGIDGWVTGDTLFQNTVVSFDVAKERVGFE